MNAIDLKGRMAIVTGAARGIGHATAQKCLASGATVALWDIDAAALDKAVSSLKQSGRVHAAVVDVTDEASIAAAVDALIRDVGRIDILVNNAGITGGNAPLWQLAPEVWRRVVEVNLVAPYLVCRAVVPHMIAAGYGRIVNIASIAGKDGNPNASHYSASKAGLIGLTKSLGKELATTGVLVNCHHAGCGEDRAVRPDEAGAYRLHAVENSDEPLRHRRRDCGHGRMARFGGVLVLDRRGVRYFRRPGGVLSRHSGPAERGPASRLHDRGGASSAVLEGPAARFRARALRARNDGTGGR